MKLKEIANIIKGVYLKEELSKKVHHYKELSMVSLEPISFIDERKVIDVKSSVKVLPSQITKAGDVVVSLYYPMIACYVEQGQEGYVVPHYMAIIRLKPYVNIDSRFIVQFINSTRGRKALCSEVNTLYDIRPTTLPLKYLNNADILEKENVLVESF